MMSGYSSLHPHGNSRGAQEFYFSRLGRKRKGARVRRTTSGDTAQDPGPAQTNTFPRPGHTARVRIPNHNYDTRYTRELELS